MLNRTLMAAVVLAAILIAASPLIVRGVENFKTFLSLTSLLNHCDGAGSPRC
jgi:hypothetical protein